MSGKDGSPIRARPISVAGSPTLRPDKGVWIARMACSGCVKSCSTTSQHGANILPSPSTILRDSRSNSLASLALPKDLAGLADLARDGLLAVGGAMFKNSSDKVSNLAQ